MKIKLKDLLDLVDDYEIIHLRWYERTDDSYFDWEGTVCQVPIRFKSYVVNELHIEETEAFCSKFYLDIDKR